jgi:hypothetical protein
VAGARDDFASSGATSFRNQELAFSGFAGSLMSAMSTPVSPKIELSIEKMKI